MLFLLLLFLPIFSCKLLMVLEIFRHGAREPVYDYWNARTFREFGELTSVGMHQHYLLGQHIRKLYVEDQPLLSRIYQPEEVYVRSTDLNRTITSAISHLYGLFPLNEGPLIPKGIEEKYLYPPFRGIYQGNGSRKIWEKKFGLKAGFQPVPVLTFQEKDDYLLRPFMWSACPGTNLLEKMQKNTEKYQAWANEFEGTFNEIEKIVNTSETMTCSEITMETALRAYDVFYADMFFNKLLPEHLDEGLWRNLSFVADMHLFYLKFGTTLQQRLQCHSFFSEILEDFDEKINNNNASSFKMKIFSAHDLTLGYLLTGLNLTSYQCIEEIFRNNHTNALNCFNYPTYASNMLIELYFNEEIQKPEVMIKYNGEYVNLCEKKQKTCDYDEFKARLQDFLLEDFMSVCKNRNKKYDKIPYKYLFE